MDSLRRDVIASTAQISSILTRYSKLAEQASTSYSSTGRLTDDVGQRKDQMEGEIDVALEIFSNKIEELANMQATAHPPPSTSTVHALERHRETYTEYRRDYQRTKASLREAQQKANLLGSVRDEISAFKSSSNSSTTDALLSERNRIDSSHRMTDDILGQAYETRAEFGRQRSNIQGINLRMGNVITQIPALNSVLGMINSRRRRDSLIMGGVIGICTLILMWWVFGSGSEV